MLEISPDIRYLLSSDGTCRKSDVTLGILEKIDSLGNAEDRRNAVGLLDLIPDSVSSYKGKIEHGWWNSEEGINLWNEAWDFAEEVSPDGYYFGSDETDPTRVGWFKEEEENYDSE